MTHADMRMNPIHFGSDPANIQFRLIPEIRIRIPDQIWALAELALSECSYWNCSQFPSLELFGVAGQTYLDRRRER